MNYVAIYDKLIRTRKHRVLDASMYYENHHIIMKSMGGTNDPENLVKLTAKEHFLAHRLLMLIHCTGKNALRTSYAYLKMCNCLNTTRQGVERRKVLSSRMYAAAKEKHSREISKFRSGRKHSLLTIEKMKISASKRIRKPYGKAPKKIFPTRTVSRNRSRIDRYDKWKTLLAEIPESSQFSRAKIASVLNISLSTARKLCIEIKKVNA